MNHKCVICGTAADYNCPVCKRPFCVFHGPDEEATLCPMCRK
jgi:hypothetical protein